MQHLQPMKRLQAFGDLFDDADKSAAEILSGVADEPINADGDDEFAGYDEEENE